MDFIKILSAFDYKQVTFWIQKYGEETLLKDCMQTLGLRICELVNFDKQDDEDEI
jgi:hypothetical protein